MNDKVDPHPWLGGIGIILVPFLFLAGIALLTWLGNLATNP